LRELNENWTHSIVDEVRDTLGENIHAYFQGINLGIVGVRPISLYTPYGIRWQYLFEAGEESGSCFPFELAKKEGVSFKSGEDVVLLTLSVKPTIKEGSSFVKLIAKTENQSGSQLIEAKTGDKISFEESQYQLTISK